MYEWVGPLLAGSIVIPFGGWVVKEVKRLDREAGAASAKLDLLIDSVNKIDNRQEDLIDFLLREGRTNRP